MIYNYPDLQVSFSKIPRAASRTIMRSMLGGYADPSDHIEFKSFAVVRNPYERVSSCISMFKNGHFRRHFQDINLDVPYIINVVENSTAVPRDKDSNWFLKWHAMPMTDPLFQIAKVDRIFRFEHLSDEWSKIAEFIGLDRVPEMPHIGKRSDNIHLTQRDRDMVYECFKLDFETFGYER